MKHKKLNGFTLIELMIAVAILAIITAFAYPSYQNYIRKSRRSEAKIELEKIAMAQERFFSANNGYTSDLSQLPGYDANPVTTENGYYTINAAINGATLTLTATPVAGKGQDEDTCTQFTLDTTGKKDATPSKDVCW
jgi:type IV pilus assembly protein PilE